MTHGLQLCMILWRKKQNNINPPAFAGVFMQKRIGKVGKNESKKAGKKIKNRPKNYLQNGNSACIIFGQK